MSVESPSIKDILKCLSSGIALDVAKNHTGIIIWNGSDVEIYGFSIGIDDLSDPFWEYKMRRAFKEKLTEIIRGRHFENVVIENVYGGENFYTVRVLLALNTVIDDLLFDHVCTFDKFYRWGETEWLSKTRLIYKATKGLKSKVEVQEILRYLQWDFLLEHENDRPSVKESIFFEDKCDAMGMLLAVAISKTLDVGVKKEKKIKLSDIKMYYCKDTDDLLRQGCKRFEDDIVLSVELDVKNLEKSIISQVTAHPDDLLCAKIPPNKLGLFGMKHGFEFFDADIGYLVFYQKR